MNLHLRYQGSALTMVLILHISCWLFLPSRCPDPEVRNTMKLLHATGTLMELLMENWTALHPEHLCLRPSLPPEP